MKRILTILIAVVMVLGMLPVTTFAAFDTENFVGIVLTVADETFKVEMYSGITSTKTLMTPVHTEGNAYYYEVAVGSYCYIAKPVSGSSHYKIRKNFYVTEDMAATKTVWDVTPPVRTTTGWDYTEVQCYADVVMEKAFPSSPDLWPKYAELLKTPALTIPRTEHQMTTQTEMMDYINGLDTKGDDMYVFTLGKGAGPSGQQLDIPVVFFTKTDLSGVTTWEEAADLVCSNGKLTAMYQAQIHGDEPATGEAALAMLKAFNGSYGAGLLGNMNICVMPRLNVYGAYRADRLVYANGQYIDPNRDFLQLQGQEVVLRTQIFQRLEPEICFDTHEYIVHTEYTNVDMHDMQLSTNFSVKSTDDFCDTALTLCYEAFDRAKENNLSYDWYSNAITGYNANIGTCNVAYRGSLVFLTETQGKYGGSQQLERRMMGHISMVTGVLDYVNEHTDAVQQVVDEQRQVIVDRGLTYDESDIIVLKSNYSDREEHYINGQRIHTASGVISDSLFLGHIYDVVDRSRVAPTAYVIPAGESWNAAVLEKLSQHGIAYTQLPAGTIISLQQYLGTVKETTLTEEKPVSFPNGAYVMTMAQEDAYILALLMEPDVDDLAENKGTFAQMGLISAENEKFPIYRYIQDLNSDAFIDYTVASAAPAGLTVEAVTAIGGTGKITGLDATKIYEYRAADAEEYTPVAAGSTEIAGLPLGEYLVRFAAAQDVLPSADALVTVGYDLDAYIVYVDGANGTKTNDAYTESTAASTYTVAKGQLDLLMKYAPAGTTGVVKILGTYNMTKTSAGMSSLPAHDYPLLITGGTLIYKNTGSDQKWLRMGGDTTFDNITIKPGSNSNAYFLCGNGHKLTIGPNVTSLANGSYYFNIMGGIGEYSNDQYAAQTDLTIQSGTWRYVYAGGYVSGVTETAKAQLSNCSVARICGSYNGHLLGDLYLSLDNVTVRENEIYCGNIQKNNVSGNVTLVLGENINAANIYAGSNTAGNVGGTVTIIADGVDLSKTTIHGKAKNTTGTIGGLAIELRQGQLADVAASFITRNGVSVKLGCQQTKAVTLPYDINLDLNGYDMAAVDLNGNDITCTGSGSMVCKDSKTDDFDVEDGIYGTVTAGEQVKAAPGYLAVTEGGKTSFHKYEMEVTELVVNPTERGITYKSSFKGDQKVQSQVKEFGVAMRAYNAPNEMSIWADPDCYTHVALDKSQWKIGNSTDTVKSVYVSSIIKPTLTAGQNQLRSEVEVFGRSYILLADGTMLFGTAYGFSMQGAFEYVDTFFNNDEYLSDTDREKLVAFYTDEGNHAFMQNWNLPNIKAAAGEESA